MIGKIRRFNIGYRAIEHDDIPPNILTRDQFADNEIQMVLEVPLICGGEQTVSAETAGYKYFSHTAQLLLSEHLKHLKSAKLLVDFTWAATANGRVQLHDATADATLAESPYYYGGESDDDLVVDVTGTLVAGNRIVMRAHVAVAGATGETVSLFRAILKLIVGIS